VSGVVDPSGRVVRRAPVREQVVLEQTVPLVSGRTPGIRVGAAVDAALAVLAMGAVVAALLLGLRRGRRSAEPDRPPETSTATPRRPAEPSGSGPLR
jgi:apolipoprotein N-acyltransferase